MPFLFFYYVLFLLFSLSPAKTLSISASSNNLNDNPWRDFARLIDVERGTSLPGIDQLRNYFIRFGYLTSEEASTAASETFDAALEAALVSYQQNLGLPVTGRLDSQTLDQIMSPRCGLRDTSTTPFLETRRFAYFSGRPRWDKPAPITLTYAFAKRHTVDYLGREEIRGVFRRAFLRWSAVIPVNFTETAEYGEADVKIGFFAGEHGDGEPFDGVLGILAHAFSPENGRLHLDAAERWAVDFGAEGSSVAVDLESVATHEIGHVLGLAHSSVKEAVMYPNLNPRTRKVELRVDDVEGVQALYGSNPNFKYSSLLASVMTSGGAGGGSGNLDVRWWCAVLAVVVAFLL